MATGVSAPLRPSSSPLLRPNRRTLRTLWRLDAYCSIISVTGGPIFAAARAMHTAGDAVRRPAPPPPPTSFPSPPVVGWHREIAKMKQLEMINHAKRLRDDIASGNKQLADYSPNGKVSGFAAVREGRGYAQVDLNRLSNEQNGGGRRCQPEGNNSRVELALTQTVKEGFCSNGVPAGDVTRSSSFINGERRRISVAEQGGCSNTQSNAKGGRPQRPDTVGHTRPVVEGNCSKVNHRQPNSSMTGTETKDIRANGNGIPTGDAGGDSAFDGHSRVTRIKQSADQEIQRKRLLRIYDKVLVVDDIKTAKEVVHLLTTKYKEFIHGCDTEVANIDVKQDTPVNHGEIICFSIYSGPKADFGGGKSGIWVDVLDGERDVLMEFAPFFEDPSIKKVWHNYSFDSHIVENYGIKLSGFHADTMHLARLWDSSRRIDGGYSLEALTSDPNVMLDLTERKKISPEDLSGAESYNGDDLVVGKISMKSIFGKKKAKKDGSEGKLTTIAPVDMLQRGEERKPWICYSVLDSISTLRLFESLEKKLRGMTWSFGETDRGTMYDFYQQYWRPFGELLVEMESEGMLVDRDYLSEIEKVAIAEQKFAAERFRNWASEYCPDAKYMNVGSDAQLRQLFFGGRQNSKDQNETLTNPKTFKVPNIENVIEEGKKTPSKYRTITLQNITKDSEKMETDIYTPSGWPSVSGDALKTLAGKIPTSEIFLKDDKNGSVSNNHSGTSDAIYGSAYNAFGGSEKGVEACHAIAALCEVCSIDSLISNFILPLQGDHISGKNGRIHCSLNINTETGRLSARRPNLQNQPALEKDRYKIRQAFIAKPGNSLIVADYGQLELRILAHLANCPSMLKAFKAGGDFHSRTAMNMYDHVNKAVNDKEVLLEWHPQPGEDKPPVPLLKDVYGAERRKAKMLNFSIAYGKTPVGLSRDWKVSLKEARNTVKLWYKGRKEVLEWQEERKKEAREQQYVTTLLGRRRRFPSLRFLTNAQKGHIERAAINTPVQGSAADVAMCAMLEIDRNPQLKVLGWKLLLQVHDEVILEGPTESAEIAKAIVVECMSKPFNGTNPLRVDLSVDAKCAQNWYAAK